MTTAVVEMMGWFTVNFHFDASRLLDEEKRFLVACGSGGSQYRAEFAPLAQLW